MPVMLPELICTPPCNECCVQQSSFLLDTNCTPKHNSEDAYKTLYLYQTLNLIVTCHIKISYLQKIYHILLTARFVRSMCTDQFLSISCLTSVCQGSALEDTGIKETRMKTTSDNSEVLQDVSLLFQDRKSKSKVSWIFENIVFQFPYSGSHTFVFLKPTPHLSSLSSSYLLGLIDHGGLGKQHAVLHILLQKLCKIKNFYS